MALSQDKSKLYALLEGPVYNPNTGQYEIFDGKTALKILEFDLNKEKWTGRFWLYQLESKDYSIGDFNVIGNNMGLIIERDDLQGTTAYPCTNKQAEERVSFFCCICFSI